MTETLLMLYAMFAAAGTFALLSLLGAAELHARRRRCRDAALRAKYLRIVMLYLLAGEGPAPRFPMIRRAGARLLLVETVAGLAGVTYGLDAAPLRRIVAEYGLDAWLETGPWLKLVFLVIGIIAGFMNVYEDTQRLLRKMSREEEQKRAEALADRPERVTVKKKTVVPDSIARACAAETAAVSRETGGRAPTAQLRTGTTSPEAPEGEGTKTGGHDRNDG